MFYFAYFSLFLAHPLGSALQPHPVIPGHYRNGFFSLKSVRFLTFTYQDRIFTAGSLGLPKPRWLLEPWAGQDWVKQERPLPLHEKPSRGDLESQKEKYLLSISNKNQSISGQEGLW